MSDDELDQTVHDYKNIEASLINNDGREAQIQFILEWEMED